MPHRGREGQRAAALHNHAGVAMGSVPLQVGTGGKQEQGQPWAESQFLGMGGKQEQGQPWAKSQFLGMGGKQEQGQPWAKSQIKGWVAGAGTAMGREPKQGTDGKQEQGNRGISALQKGDGQQQGNRGISAFAERGRTTRQLKGRVP